MEQKHEASILSTQEKPFTHFELNLDQTEKECLANFNIGKEIELNGVLEDLEQSLEQVKDFIISAGENDLSACSVMLGIIFKVAHQALDIFQKDSAYIMLRMFVPNENYKIPRWHQDGYYFSPRSGTPFKAAIPLKGAGTLFYKLPAEELKTFRQIKDRQQAAEFLADESKKESTPPAHGSVFTVGPEGAIHSEPYMTSQRFFMSVLPGTKKQIEEWDSQCKLTNKLKADGKTPAEIGRILGEYYSAQKI